MKISLFIVLLLGSTSLSAQQRQYPPITLEEVTQLYDSLYLASELDSMPWNGDTTTCSCGNLPDSIHEKVQKRLDFFRLTNRLPTVAIATDRNKMTQEAALIGLANKRLTHYPSTKSKCFTKIGQSGCKTSCLGKHYQKYPLGINFITGFIMDYGSHNAAVGHRKWLLHSRLDSVSYGATPYTEALWVRHTRFSLNEIPTFVAYPWSGCVPQELIYPKWSFSIPYNRTVDMSRAKVTMWDASNQPITTKIIHRDNDRDATIVWIPTTIFPKANKIYNKEPISKYLHQKIRIKIEEIYIKDKAYSYEYFVQPVDLDK